MEGMDWRDSALCQYVDGERFFPAKGQNANYAKHICRACPVIAACRSYALAHDDVRGVWGGMSERELALARKKSGKIAG